MGSRAKKGESGLSSIFWNSPALPQFCMDLNAQPGVKGQWKLKQCMAADHGIFLCHLNHMWNENRWKGKTRWSNSGIRPFSGGIYKERCGDRYVQSMDSWTWKPRHWIPQYSLWPASARHIKETSLSRKGNLLTFTSRKQWLTWLGPCKDQRLPCSIHFLSASLLLALPGQCFPVSAG